MWSSTLIPGKYMSSSIGSLIRRSFCRSNPDSRLLRLQPTSIERMLPILQCSMGQQYAWHPQRLVHRILFSNTALSSETEAIVRKERKHARKSNAVASVPRRRRRLRISSVPTMNIGGGSEYDRMWNANVKKFRAFVQQNFPTTKGQAPRRIQPSDFPKDKSLRNWLRRVRVAYQKKLRGQKNRLTEQRVEQLRQLGFQFIETAYRNSWDTLFQQLCVYLKKHDGRYPHEADISKLSKEDMKLYIWCNRQRVLCKLFLNGQYDKTYMNEKRIKVLNSINFVWSVLETQWDEKYEELKQYFKANGTTLVPARYASNYSLGRWVETQRRQYTLLKQNRPSNLTEERIQLLNNLNFIWDPLEERWMERFKELKEYQRLNGHSTMPTNASNPSLRRWLLKQRKYYHKWINGEPSKMTTHRKELLDQLGMDWELPP